MSQHDDAYWDVKVTEAAEQAAGFYYEKTKHDIDLVLEALDAAKTNLDKIPVMEQDIADMKSDIHVIKKVLKATSSDLREHHRRITGLESAAGNA